MRVKLTIAMTAIIVVAVAISSFLILSYERENTMSNIEQVAQEDTAEFVQRLSLDIGSPGLEESVKDNYILSVFKSTPGFSEFVLYRGDYLTNNTGIDVARINNGDDDNIYSASLINVNETDYYIVPAIATFMDWKYDIILVRDVSEEINGITNLAVQCVYVALGVTLMSLVIMWFVLHKSLKPIKKLKQGAEILAEGNYENRIEIKTKDEFGELARDFNVMADAIEENVSELQEKSIRQQAFINDLSHELKTPVTSILLSTETLLGRKVSKETIESSLERIHAQGKHLERLSGKLMSLVLLQREIPLKKAGVAELLENVKNSTADMLAVKKITLETACNVDYFNMDVDLMQSALVNLVDNSRKASLEGGSIAVSVSERGFAVRDSGRGIPKSEIERVSEPFYMVDRSRNKKLGGSGLGLALVGKIAEVHGLEVAIESEKNVGTTVYLSVKNQARV